MSLPMPIMLATPLAAIIIPSVATSVGMPVMVTTRPLIKPHRVPAARPPRMHNQTGRPMSSMLPVTTATSARTEPTDRSSCPEMSMIVVPVAMISSTVDCSKISLMASGCR